MDKTSEQHDEIFPFSPQYCIGLLSNSRVSITFCVIFPEQHCVHQVPRPCSTRSNTSMYMVAQNGVVHLKRHTKYTQNRTTD